MSEFLCLRFYSSVIATNSVVSWTVVSATAQVNASGHTHLVHLADALPELAPHTRCIVFVPASCILLTSVELPAKQRRHLKQVLPFVVEEQIIDPVENMHLATPILIDSDTIPVAAVKKYQIAGWLDQLIEADINPDYIFPDACSVPDSNGNWQLLFENKQLLFRDGSSSGMVLEDDMTNSVLGLSISSTADVETTDALESEKDIALILVNTSDWSELEALKRQSLDIASTTSKEELAEVLAVGSELPSEQKPSAFSEDDLTKAIEDLPDDAVIDSKELKHWVDEIDAYIRSENLSTQQINYSETAAELLAVSTVRSLEKNLNLLQGEFRPANANAQSRKFIRNISMAIAACLGLFLVITLVGGAYLNYRADSYFDKSVAIYRDLFPKQRKVVDPVKQMKRQLRGQTVGGTTSEFLPLLDAASRSLSTLEQESSVEASIKQLRYDVQRGSISIDIHANNIDELEAYKDLLVQEGLSVDILSANQDGDIVKGRLQIGRS